MTHRAVVVLLSLLFGFWQCLTPAPSHTEDRRGRYRLMHVSCLCRCSRQFVSLNIPSTVSGNSGLLGVKYATQLIVAKVMPLNR